MLGNFAHIAEMDFTPTEDLMIWKAFLIAIRKKGTQNDLQNKSFQRSIYATYKKYVGRNNKNLLKNQNMGKGAGGLLRVGTAYKVRSAEDVGRRFKEKIAPEVSQFVRDFSLLANSNQKQTEMSEAVFYRGCLKLLKEKYGDEVDVELCHKYMVARHNCEKSLQSSLGSSINESEEEKVATQTAYDESVFVNCVVRDCTSKNLKEKGIGCTIYDPIQGGPPFSGSLGKLMEKMASCNAGANRSSVNSVVGSSSLIHESTREKGEKRKNEIFPCDGPTKCSSTKVNIRNKTIEESMGRGSARRNIIKKSQKSTKFRKAQALPPSSIDVALAESVSEIDIPKDLENGCCSNTMPCEKRDREKRISSEKSYICIFFSLTLLLCCIGVIIMGVLYLRVGGEENHNASGNMTIVPSNVSSIQDLVLYNT